MSLSHRIHELLAEIGPVLDLLIIDEYEAENFWHIAMDAETIFFAEIDIARGILVLSAELGTPAAIERAKFYELLLTYNHHWDATAGMRLTLDAPNGAVWLWGEIAVQVLDRTSLGGFLQDYRTKIGAWREIVRDFAKSADTSIERFDLHVSQGMIRG
jgi:hypothetical protein